MFPNVIFPRATTVTTLFWEKNTTYYNLNKYHFPNATCINFIGSHPCQGSTFSRFPLWIADSPPKYSHPGMKNLVISPAIREMYFNEKDDTVKWAYSEWVNYRWLESQFNELFAAVQNELQGPEMK